ncbi:MAG: hypothetical protein JWP89_5787 [Schlesneria sp.]|nr:hypothetical protein [Schlesneria sp.]
MIECGGAHLIREARTWILVCIVQRPASTEMNSVGIVGFDGADFVPFELVSMDSGFCTTPAASTWPRV